MKSMIERLKSVITQLQVGHELLPVQDISSETQKQFKQFHLLSHRATTGDSLQGFLNNYDAMLRLIEVLVLQYGYRLGEQPHATARKIVAILNPTFDFRHLSNVRHSAKKMRINPQLEDINQLLTLIGELSNATKHLSQNE